jgi:transcription antitermination factor NusG
MSTYTATLAMAASLNTNDLLDLTNALTRMVKERLHKESIAASLNFEVGQRVRVVDPRHGKFDGKVGTIKKIATKNVVLDLDGSLRGLRAPATMLVPA